MSTAPLPPGADEGFAGAPEVKTAHGGEVVYRAHGGGSRKFGNCFFAPAVGSVPIGHWSAELLERELNAALWGNDFEHVTRFEIVPGTRYKIGAIAHDAYRGVDAGQPFYPSTSARSSPPAGCSAKSRSSRKRRSPGRTMCARPARSCCAPATTGAKRRHEPGVSNSRARQDEACACQECGRQQAVLAPWRVEMPAQAPARRVAGLHNEPVTTDGSPDNPGPVSWASNGAPVALQVLAVPPGTAVLCALPAPLCAANAGTALCRPRSCCGAPHCSVLIGRRLLTTCADHGCRCGSGFGGQAG